MYFAKKIRGAWWSVKYYGRYTTAGVGVEAQALKRRCRSATTGRIIQLQTPLTAAEGLRSPTMAARKKVESPGFAALMKVLLRTVPYKCILCGNRPRFSSTQAGGHASELVAERLHNIDRKRWLLAQDTE